ncbi:MAG: lipoprotein-releasing ABC transporter permease subunit [Nitrospiraceae bacterium]|jgi:lipoprotein-releasing system permease protein|nr:lipoprotein-releasing ABC transporter permease subunit [Nitrospiraceae bacterium]
MKLPYQFFIALRYLKSKKRHGGVSFNTAVSIGGVAVGVMALLVVLSVMSGFHEDLQNKILGANAHAVVMTHKGAVEDYPKVMEIMKSDPQVQSAAPFALGQVMVSSGKRAHGVFMRGIEPKLEFATTDILKKLKVGNLDNLKEKDGKPWIVIGYELAAILGIIPGDTINIVSPVGEVGPLGMLPKVKQFVVADIFQMGMFEYDTNLVLTDLRSAQDFFGYGTKVTGIELRLKDVYKAQTVHATVQEKLGFPYYARDWMQMNRNLFSALKLEKLAMFVILVLIILVASFNIVSTLMMNVVEKEREIAILKSMGSTNREIMHIFMLQGLLIGLVGTLIGLTLGSILCYVLNEYKLIELPADIYYLSKLPVKVNLLDFAVVSVSAIVISFLSTIYPSWQAAKLNPVEPLRYE